LEGWSYIMLPERRFKGSMSEQYRLVRLAIPDFDELQGLVADVVASYPSRGPSAPTRVLDLGCGDGATSATILSRRPDASVTALDSEDTMVRRATENLVEPIREGRCRVVLHDALGYLRGLPACSFDVVASALALHNLHRDYRQLLHGELYRVLTPGGLFVNADKYAGTDEERFRGLQAILGRFFDTFVPLGQLDLLRDAVLHEVADEAPDRVMRAAEAVRELAEIGFRDIEVRRRHDTSALLVARKSD
jgi:tRNA (cmo5U34)-methyltransferase